MEVAVYWFVTYRSIIVLLRGFSMGSERRELETELTSACSRVIGSASIDISGLTRFVAYWFSLVLSVNSAAELDAAREDLWFDKSKSLFYFANNCALVFFGFWIGILNGSTSSSFSSLMRSSGLLEIVPNRPLSLSSGRAFGFVGFKCIICAPQVYWFLSTGSWELDTGSMSRNPWSHRLLVAAGLCDSIISRAETDLDVFISMFFPRTLKSSDDATPGTFGSSYAFLKASIPIWNIDGLT